jgi:hypothetical protein
MNEKVATILAESTVLRMLSCCFTDHRVCNADVLQALPSLLAML